jgi:hypothetical protein
LEVAFNHPDEPDGGDLNPETAQRFMLGPGDLFRVPAGNCYRLENHSEESACFLTWTIIKPRYLPASSGLLELQSSDGSLGESSALQEASSGLLELLSSASSLIAL